MDEDQIIKKLLAFINKYIPIIEINNANIFYDEPPYFLYIAQFDKDKFYYPDDFFKMIQLHIENFSGSGISFKSKKLALLKCLAELIERFHQFRLPPKPDVTTNYNQLKKRLDCLQLEEYSSSPSIKLETFAWSKGRNITKDTACHIPTQLIFLSHILTSNEKQLSEVISTGSAFSLSHEQTLLAGIYEVVERDAYMSHWLLKLNSPKIELTNIPDFYLASLYKKCLQYRLIPHVFDITNDIGIPSYITYLEDISGLEPTITIGTKSNLNATEAIIGSIEESCMSRPGIRQESYLFSLKNKSQAERFGISEKKYRKVLWGSHKTKKKLNYLLEKPLIIPTLSSFKLSHNEELKTVLRMLEKKECDVYYSDFGTEESKKEGFFLYKVIIPTLQPLYIDYKKPFIKRNRLQNIATFFNTKYSINTLPHPLL